MLTPSASNKEITIKEALNKKTKLQQLSDDLKIESDQHSLLKQKYQLLQSNLIQKSKFANDLIRKQQDDYDLKIAVLENQMESMNQVDVQQISVLKDQKIKIEKDYLEAMQVSSMLELKIKDLIACCKEHEETNQKLIDQAEKDVQTQTDLKESNKSLTDLFYVSQGELIYLQKTFDQDRRTSFTLLETKDTELKRLNSLHEAAMKLKDNTATIARQKYDEFQNRYSAELIEERQKVKETNQILIASSAEVSSVKRAYKELDKKLTDLKTRLISQASQFQLESDKSIKKEEQNEKKLLKALEYIRNLESERNVIQIANLKWKALLNDKNQEIEKMNTFNDKLVKALEQEMQGCFGQKDVFKTLKWGWTDDNVTKQCSVDWCDVEFGILKRKSHCRRCGQIFCKDHVKSGYKLGLSGESFDENGYECKLCDDCVDILENCNTGSIVRHE